jgi:hypothetical protein
MVIKNFQECDFFTHPPKLSNQNKVFIWYNVLIGWFFGNIKNLCSKVYDRKS